MQSKIADAVLRADRASTGRQKEAKRYVDRYKRLDAALDAFYSDSGNRRPESNVSISKINALFDRYKGDPFVPHTHRHTHMAYYHRSRQR